MNFFKRKEKRQLFPYISSYYSSGVFNAEKNLAVDVAVSKIANTIAALPIRLFCYTNNGKREAYWNSIDGLLKDPAVEETATLFYKTLVRHLLVKGNAYIFKHKSKGEVVALELVDPGSIRIDRTQAGRKLYVITGERGGTFTDSNIIHIPYTGEGYNGTLGRSPVDVHKRDIERNDFIEEYIKVFFKNGIGSRLLVELGDKFEPGSPKLQNIVQEFQAYFNAFVSGAENANKPIITPPNTKITKVEQSSNVQTDVLNIYKESTASIYRLFNIPPEIIDSENNKYNSLEQKNADYLQSCIYPLCKHIAECLMKGLLDGAPSLFIQYDFSALQETDLGKKSDRLIKEFHSGVITLNELRSELNLSSVENDTEGNTRWIPGNLIPLTESNIDAILAKSKAVLNEDHNPIGDDKL